ncbi:hypothetical protein CQ018_04705 [Arthrobacter sp. MYb227]|uniref:hypothetical protein n=1 Tax=Arthrobacter sp. MYb227 TaxID=1848601 RepID=UPI000CFDEAC1|nr:hypothetical protein [Arthrobacter sp. MYb227]PQZ94656.1 hypothetical protein CQ018_04705 [Arthrobacter sp. MYb227]
MVNRDVELIDLIWPKTLIPPIDSAKLLYLDLNHWINLAKVKLGKGGATRYWQLLEACQLAVKNKKVRIVLSDALAEEIFKIRDPRQRNDIVSVIDELTDYEYLAGLADVKKLELQATLDEMTGTRGLNYSQIPLVGGSLLHAFGKVGGLLLTDADGKPIDRTLLSEEEQRKLKVIDREAERQLLAGPKDDDIPELRRSGYAPEIVQDSLQDNAQIEQSFANEQLDDRMRRGRLKDVLTARELFHELNEMLARELSVRKITFALLTKNIHDARRLVHSMPSSCVAVELKTNYHRNAARKWTVNDIRDIHAMSLAIPYCDIVFTDAAVRDCLIRSKLPARMRTLVPNKPDDLVQLLSEL